MLLKLLFFHLLIFVLPLIAFTQIHTVISNSDSAGSKKDKQNGELAGNNYFVLLGYNLKQSFTRPFHMNGQNRGDLLKFALVAGALSLADEPIQKGAFNLRNDHKSLANVSKNITSFGGIYEAYTFAALGAYGLVFKNEKIKTTTLLATQAYLTGSAVETVVKFLSGRTRPSVYATGTEAEPSFLGPFSKNPKDAIGKKVYSSFPSGHTTVAFAAATVFALAYRDKPIVPVIAYSAATLIGLSRITENKHWSTDVLAGAALGFITGKQVVKNYHRYTNTSVKNKNTLTFNLRYSFGRLTPGLTYTFR